MSDSRHRHSSRHHHRHSRRYHSRSHEPSNFHRNDGLDRLNLILKKTVPDIKQVAGHPFLEEILGKPVHKWDRLLIGLDCDEVFPNIYIGNRGAAQNKEYLTRLGITHVLNAADGKTKDQVNTGQEFYKGTSIIYMGMDITDTTDVKLEDFFEPAAKFIDNALKKNGKVFVNCLMGMSRSGTMVIAYLMIKLGMTAEKALTTVRTYRDIRPNYGFLCQLVKLERSLGRHKSEKRSRDRSKERSSRNHDSNEHKRHKP